MARARSDAIPTGGAAATAAPLLSCACGQDQIGGVGGARRRDKLKAVELREPPASRAAACAHRGEKDCRDCASPPQGLAGCCPRIGARGVGRDDDRLERCGTVEGRIAGDRGDRQRRRHHRLRNRAEGALPGAQRQYRRPGEGAVRAPRQSGEHGGPAEGAAAGGDPLQPRQVARGAGRHLPGAAAAVRHGPAEAGDGECSRLGAAQAAQGRQGGADRGAPQAAGGQEARHRGVRRTGQGGHPGDRRPQQDDLRPVRPAPEGHGRGCRDDGGALQGAESLARPDHAPLLGPGIRDAA